MSTNLEKIGNNDSYESFAKYYKDNISAHITHWFPRHAGGNFHHEDFEWGLVVGGRGGAPLDGWRGHANSLHSAELAADGATTKLFEKWDITEKEAAMAQYHPAMLQFFRYEHLPTHLQSVSKNFFDLAEVILKTLPDNDEKLVALRKLLEAKDCAVRSVIYKEHLPK